MTQLELTPAAADTGTRLAALCAAFSHTETPGQALTAMSAAADALTDPDGLPPLWPTLATTTSLDLVAELTSARGTLLHARADADPRAAQALREAAEELDRALGHLRDDAAPARPTGPSRLEGSAGTPGPGGAVGAGGAVV